MVLLLVCSQTLKSFSDIENHLSQVHLERMRRRGKIPHNCALTTIFLTDRSWIVKKTNKPHLKMLKTGR